MERRQDASQSLFARHRRALRAEVRRPYYRVSTDKQGRSGLGLEAQREAVSRHVASAAGTVIDEFEEIESGKRNDRPKIAAALGACRARHATLIIAKLDRLARNVAFVSNLMESDVDFVACDNPFATRLTIHILAAVAEHEREMISARTIAALAAAKARGVKLGNPRGAAHLRGLGNPAGVAALKRGAMTRAEGLRATIEAIRAEGVVSANGIAGRLNEREIATPRGGRWSARTVSDVLARLA